MRALVIDGNSLIYRCYYASLKQLEYYKNNNLQPVNALKLMMLIVLKIISNQSYDYALVAFDASKKTLRHQELEEYKAGRKPMPQELVTQLPLINEAINAMGIQTLSIDQIEADDIIGGFCKIMNNENIEVDIYSSDKDMLQLINEKTNVYMFKTGVSDVLKVTAGNIKEVFNNLEPHQVVDFKGISGDSSDNLVGVKGIGPITASKLILEYGNLENIYDNLDKLSENIKKKFIENKDHAFLCKKLSTIDTTILNDYAILNFINKGVDKQKILNIINKYHFNGFNNYL
ncbi:MAG: 5'-3' exonuclease [Mycoplasmataceae bacterium]|jgi:DNA polymerase-1|nr:5'-3' exonuclease [Mycoplasmataceae bacterium]